MAFVVFVVISAISCSFVAAFVLLLNLPFVAFVSFVVLPAIYFLLVNNFFVFLRKDMRER